MFSVLKRKFGTLDYLQLHNDHSGEFVGVIPAIGGLINDFYIENSERLINIFDSYKDHNELTKDLTNNYKGVKLSPFPNRIKDGKYTFENENFELHVNMPAEGHSIHGLVYDQPFEVTDTASGDDYASIQLKFDYDGSKKGYPFKYTMVKDIMFTEGNQLIVTTHIENTDIRTMPIGDGWHPYIKTGSKVDNLMIQFPSKGQVLVDERMIPNEEAVAFTDFNEKMPLADTQFDDCFMLDENEAEHVTTITDNQKNITIDIWQQGGERAYNYLQIYTPAARDSIAIEPMTCIPNAFNNEVGLLSLVPGETITLKYGIGVEVD